MATTSAASMADRITAREYLGIQGAFDFFNARLFGGELPQCLVTLQRVKRARGYFWKDQFKGRHSEFKTDEIALNPDTFDGRTDRDILSTLAHEMTHLWQHYRGTPGRRAYHNQEWATKMKSIGLHPSDTGAPGGKETGEHMTHYIVEGGAFAVAVDELLNAGGVLNWNASPELRGAGAGKSSKQTRQKFSCPGCGLNVWSKPDARIACADCSEDDGELVLLEVAD